MTANLLFFGTPEYSVPSLQALLDSPYRVAAVVTQPDRSVGRGKQVKFSPVKELALQAGLPVLQPESLKKEKKIFLDRLADIAPIQLGVVIALGQILPQEILSFPEQGMVNLHASLLPRWRGAAPIQRAIEAGDEKTGVCLMKMEEGLDTGPVYAREEISISKEDNAGGLHDRLASLSAELLKHSLKELLENKLLPEPQPEDGVTYAKKLEPGEELLDFQQDASTLWKKVRALSPWPAAYSYLEGKRLKIYDCSVASNAGKDLEVGCLQRTEADELFVQCADGMLLLNEVQLEGKKRMSVKEFLRGFQNKALPEKLSKE